MPNRIFVINDRCTGCSACAKVCPVTCIDASKTGDISTTGKIWVNEKIGRSISTAAIADGLLYIADFPGIVHCSAAGDFALLRDW